MSWGHRAPQVVVSLIVGLLLGPVGCGRPPAPATSATSATAALGAWSERMALPLTEATWPYQLSNASVVHVVVDGRRTAFTCAQRSRELEFDIEHRSTVARTLRLATAVSGGVTTAAIGSGQFFTDATAKTDFTAAVGLGGALITTVLAGLVVHNNAGDTLQQDSKQLAAIDAAIHSFDDSWNGLLSQYSCQPGAAKAAPPSGAGVAAAASTVTAATGTVSYDHAGDTSDGDPGPLDNTDVDDLTIVWNVQGPSWQMRKRSEWVKYLSGKRCQLGQKGQDELHLALTAVIQKLSSVCNGAPSQGSAASGSAGGS